MSIPGRRRPLAHPFAPVLSGLLQLCGDPGSRAQTGGRRSLTASTIEREVNMPLYAMVGYDHPNAVANREPIRAEHRAYIRANLQPLRLAGAFNNDRGEQIGTMLVFEADDEKTVWDWIKAEPFYRGGIYLQCEVRPWNLVIGEIAPGPAVAPVS
jgi:uncharacterized protein YciI